MSKHTFHSFDTKLKPVHLNPGANVMTVSHVGIKREPTREKITIIGGDPDELPSLEYQDTLILFFREAPLKAFALNVTNRTFLAKYVGEEPISAVGCVLTLQRKTLKQFRGTETIEIVAVKKPTNGRSPAEQKAQETARAARLAVLKTEWKKEAALLKESGQEPNAITAEEAGAWGIDEINAKIEQIQTNVEFLLGRKEQVSLRRDAEARLANLRAEASKLGYVPADTLEFGDMTDDEIEVAIQSASRYINTHQAAAT